MHISIVRIDTPDNQTHGWQVRLSPEHYPLQPATRMFHDRHHGGTHNAKLTAHAYIQDLHAELSPHNEKTNDGSSPELPTGVYHEDGAYLAHYSAHPNGSTAHAYVRFAYGSAAGRTQYHARRLATIFRHAWEIAYTDHGIDGVRHLFANWPRGYADQT
jgi:hypothetical protein